MVQFYRRPLGDLGRPAVGRTAQSNRRGDGTRERSPRKRNVKGNDLSDGGSDDKDLMRSPHRYTEESRSSGVCSARRRGIVPLLMKSVTRPRGPCWPGAPLLRHLYKLYIHLLRMLRCNKAIGRCRYCIHSNRKQQRSICKQTSVGEPAPASRD